MRVVPSSNTLSVIYRRVKNYILTIKSPKLRDFFDEEYCFEKKQQNYNQFYMKIKYLFFVFELEKHYLADFLGRF